MTAEDGAPVSIGGAGGHLLPAGLHGDPLRGGGRARSPPVSSGRGGGVVGRVPSLLLSVPSDLPTGIRPRRDSARPPTDRTGFPDSFR